MSYDLKLQRICDHKIQNEDQITEADNRTVITNFDIVNDNIRVKMNGYQVPRNRTSEIPLIEDKTASFTGTNNSFVINQPPIKDGANLNLVAQNRGLINVQIKVTDEDDSSQITGVENYIICQHIPLLTELNFSNNLNSGDVVVNVNSIPVNVLDVDSATGRITLEERPLAGDTVTVSYFFRARVDSFNAESGLVVLKETPILGQQVKVRYYALVKDGWTIISDPLNSAKKNIVFDREKKTNRGQVVEENVSTQFTGTEKQITTKYKPLMPFRVDARSTYEDVLPSNISILINGQPIAPLSMIAENGIITLASPPNLTDIVTVSYFYQTDVIPDIIRVDYQVNANRCPKCGSLGVLDDYEYDQTGNKIIVENEDKLIQDLRKYIVTIQGSNLVHPWYGTALDSMIGQKFAEDFIRMQISTEIQNAVRDLKNLQVQQENYQTVTDREFVGYINNLTINQNTTDLSIWQVYAEVVTQAGSFSVLEEQVQFDTPFFDNSANQISTFY